VFPRPIPAHYRASNDPPSHLIDVTRTNSIKTGNKASGNYNYQQNYLSFYVSSSHYQVFHIHTIQSFIDHIKDIAFVELHIT
jgi:hypothetical protein